MEELINIQSLDPQTFEYQEYSSQDTNLITKNVIETQFNPSTDYIEYFVYDVNGNILLDLTEGYTNYSILNNQLSLDPVADLKSVGYEQGNYNVLYNFLQPKIASSPNNHYFIEEISSDRKEIRLNSTQILSGDITGQATLFIEEINTSPLNYLDFYLDFGNNILLIANNLLLDSSDPTSPTLLVKLYEALPNNFQLKSECWIVEQVAESIAYNVSIEPIYSNLETSIPLKGPNLNLDIKDKINNSTPYSNYLSLSSTSTPQGSGSLQYQLNSLLVEKGIEVNIDYSDYSNFVHFSSAQTRLENFYYKLSLIEEYNYSASLSSGTNSNQYVVSSNNVWQNKINEIITGFDGYEYYLYFESGSTCWPKSNTEPPYINESSTSTIGQTWLSNQLVVAEDFDLENNNALINAVPDYLRDDPDNNQFELFIEMIGQHFDNIFIYLQDVSQKYNADNRLNYGISKDLVADVLRDMGIKIYQNNFSTNDLYSAFLGFTPSGSLYNLPYTTGSLPTPEGWEYIDTYITASSTGSLQPTDDINKSIYKRIYHNLPYLLKKKGTVEGLRALITTYGIPDTILRVNEFGGKDKINQNDWDFWYNQFNYVYNTEDNGYITTDWVLDSNWNSPNDVPGTVEFRFKTPGLDSALTSPTQSLWSLGADIELYLQYTGSGYISGSYSGSIPDVENQYANLILNIGGTTESIYLPFFDGGWWSVAVTRDNDDFTLFAGNNIYTGEEGSSIGFTGSATFNVSSTPWVNSTTSIFAGASSYNKFSGSLQEIRYYNQALSQSVFNDFVMNHNSIEGNGINSSANQLAFRAALGGELYTGSVSIHPNVTGSYITASFLSGNTFTITNGGFVSNEEYVYFDQVPVGIKNRNSNKIKPSSLILPYSGSNESNIPINTILSPFKSVQQNSYTSESYTRDVDYVEVAFSPQNEINDDIISSLGYFNIGDYIGDPRQVSSSAESYSDLDTLRDIYFEKYTHNYDIWDYIRLIKYFDNSLFKMLKDWVPARTSLAAGVVVKQHLLERNKYPVPQLNTYTTTSFEYLNNPFITQNLEITGSSIQMETITGSDGGSFSNSSISNLNTYLVTNNGEFTTPAPSAYVVFKNNIDTFNAISSNGILWDPTTGKITLDPSISSLGTADVLFDLTVGCFSPADYPVQVVLSSSAGQLISPVEATTTAQSASFSYTISPGVDYYIYLAPDDINDNINLALSITGSWEYNNQSWTGSTPSLLGPVPFVNDSQHEFFDGELSGSNLIVTTQSLNSNNPFLEVDTTVLNYTASIFCSENVTINTFLNNSMYTPVGGVIFLYFDSSSFA